MGALRITMSLIWALVSLAMFWLFENWAMNCVFSLGWLFLYQALESTRMRPSEYKMEQDKDDREYHDLTHGMTLRNGKIKE
jgi:hypothetical protein